VLLALAELALGIALAPEVLAIRRTFVLRRRIARRREARRFDAVALSAVRTVRRAGRCVVLAERAAHAPLEVVDEADARLALERARLDVLLSDLEAGELRVVLVLGCTRITDSTSLAGERQRSEHADADHAEKPSYDRTGHQKCAPSHRRRCNERF